MRIYANWTNAQSTLAKKREAKVKLELAGKHDKVQAAQDEVREVRLAGGKLVIVVSTMLFVVGR